MELIDSKVLDCTIVVCSKREKIKAEKLYPGKVIYLFGEIQELKGLTPEWIRAIHITKEALGGHLLYEDGEAKKKSKTLKEMRKKRC